LRADGVGEANRHITTAQAEKRRKDEEPQGRCHQLSGCVSCTWPLFRRSRHFIGRVSTPLRWRLDKGGRQAFGHPGGLTLALRLQQRKHLRTESLSCRPAASASANLEGCASFFLRVEALRSRRATSLSFPASAGCPTKTSVFRRSRLGKHDDGLEAK
jgi:hypothetical protein